MLESNGEGLLGALEQLLGMVFIPALSRQEKWGEITGPDMYTLRSHFISKLSSTADVDKVSMTALITFHVKNILWIVLNHKNFL